MTRKGKWFLERESDAPLEEELQEYTSFEDGDELSKMEEKPELGGFRAVGEDGGELEEE